MPAERKLTVCMFGRYDPEYNRTGMIIRGLKEAGINVIHCRAAKKGIGKYFELVAKHRLLRGSYDAMIVAFPGWHSVILARLIACGPVIFDLHYSAYDSAVCDRQNTSRFSAAALYYAFMDWFACVLSHKVLLDTNAHIEYMARTFKLSRKKFARIFVSSIIPGTREAKRPAAPGQFEVQYHGSDIPLQGVRHILEASKILLEHRDISFVFVGGRVKRRYEKSHPHIMFTGDVPHSEVFDYIAGADLCLGIFGQTGKTSRVIPNKVYESVAGGKPIITADTTAMREMFSDSDILMIPAGDPKAIADAILTLKNDPERRKRLARNGYEKFVKTASPAEIGKELRKTVISLI